MAYIQLLNIVKGYPDGENRWNEVLRGVNLELEAGDFVAVTGASGSGKTTLLSILGLLTLPDAGSYTLEGKQLPASEVERAALRNVKTGFVFQEHRLLPQYTALDNILIPVLATQRQAAPSQVAYARRLMEMTGIAPLAAKYPHTLSGGEAGRVALCRALVMKPALLLADEPTGQLDALSARNVVALLRQVNDELKTAILMVTHSAETASAARIIRTLENGILA
jgi:ABC-type lipoprotein export system ATPase subunit